MKNVSKILAAAALALIVSSGSAFAQSASANADALATIVTPISIAQVADLRFGDIAACGSASTVIMSTAGSRSVGSGCAVLAASAVGGAAEFTVSGDANNTYAITLPAAAATITSGANSMDVDTWTSNPSGTGTLSGAGTQTLNVGGTLNLAASQAAGSYSGSFSVSVVYN